MLCLKQSHQCLRSSLYGEVSLPRCLLLKPSPPVLLPLPRGPRKPPTEHDLLEETQKNDKPHRLKPPIIELGPQGMDGPTVRATISPQTQRSRKTIKIPVHVTMPPQPRTPTPRTPRRTRPRVLLPLLFQQIDIDGEIKYQESISWGITEGSSPGRKSPSVIPFSPSAYSEKKKFSGVLIYVDPPFCDIES
jgi:hypothetical protein